MTRALSLLLCFCFLVTACNAEKIIYYFADWSSISASNIRYSEMTHLMYAFVLPRANGTLDTSIDKSKLKNIVTLARASGVKVLISIGGGGGSENFKNFANSASGRTTFVSNLLAFVTQFNLDGADIDWEYPDGGYSQSYTLLMQAIWTSFKPLNLLVTSAVPAISWSGQYYLASSFAYVDFFNIMTYDFSGSWAPNAPGPHASYEQILSSFSYWLTQRSLPPSKFVLGIPFYGKDFDKGGEDITYSNIVSLYHPAPNVNQINKTYFDGIDLVKSKCQLALNKGVAGVMVWEYSQDSIGSSSLITAISSAMKSTPVPSTIPQATISPTTAQPTTLQPTTLKPTTVPTTVKSTTLQPTTLKPTTVPTTVKSKTLQPTTLKPTTVGPTTVKSTTLQPTTLIPTSSPTTVKPTTSSPTLISPTPTVFCGNGARGSGVCKDNRLCCSLWGWCGSTKAYCST